MAQAFVNITVNKAFIEIGQKEIVKIEVPIRYWDSFVTFDANIVGDTQDKFLKEEYRYSLNGLKFTKWSDIKPQTDIVIPKKSDFLIEFRFIRKGVEDSGVVTLNTISIEGNDNSSFEDVLSFDGTVFSNTNLTTISWNKIWLNLAKKLYKRGFIVPSFVERGEDVDDDDYISFIKASAYLFALIIELSNKRILEFDSDVIILSNYLEQRGLFLCGNELLSELQTIQGNYYDEIRKRGTYQIINKKDNGQTYFGELLKIICYEIEDEFIFEHTPRNLSGWTVNKTSPIYRGNIRSNREVSKSPEINEDFTDLNLFTLENAVSLSLVSDADKRVINMNNSSTSVCGIEFDTTIDPYLSYEMSIWIKNPVEFKVFVYAYDVNGDETPIGLIHNDAITNEFASIIDNASETTWYLLRLTLYRFAQPNLSSNKSFNNMNTSRNVKFLDNKATKLKIKISNQQNNAPTVDTKIWNLQFKPSNLPIDSSVCLNSYNIINIFVKNRNTSLPVKDIEENIMRYLLPYGVKFRQIYSPNLGEGFEQSYLKLNSDGYVLKNDDEKVKITS